MLKEKPWQLDRVLLLGAGLLASLAISVLAVNGYSSSLEGPDGRQFSAVIALIGTATFYGVPVVLINVFLRQHGMGWQEGFGLRRAASGRAVLLGWFTAVLMLPVLLSLNMLSGELLVWMGRDANIQSAVKLLQTTQSFGEIACLAFASVICAPIVEELVFRGIIYPFLKGLYARRVAIWVSSIMFAAMHGNAMSFLPLAVFGVVLCLLYETTGTIVATVTAHSFFNAANVFYAVVFKS